MDKKRLLKTANEVLKGEIVIDNLSHEDKRQIEEVLLAISDWYHRYESGTIDMSCVPLDYRFGVQYTYEKNKEKYQEMQEEEYNMLHGVESFSLLAEEERRTIRDRIVNKKISNLELKTKQLENLVTSLKYELNIYKETIYKKLGIIDVSKPSQSAKVVNNNFDQYYILTSIERNLDLDFTEEYEMVQGMKYFTVKETLSQDRLLNGINPFQINGNKWLFWECLDEFPTDQERAFAKYARCLMVRGRYRISAFKYMTKKIMPVWKDCSNLSPTMTELIRKNRVVKYIKSLQAVREAKSRYGKKKTKEKKAKKNKKKD